MQSKLFNNFKTVVLLGLLMGLCVGVGSLWGPRGIYIGLAMGCVMNFISYFASDKIALASMRAQEVGPEHELYQIVAPLAQRAGLPMPRVYVAPHSAPNAFATGRNPKHAAVCATEGLLQMLDRDEIAGVMAHELAHVKHRDILIQTVAATIAGALSAFMWFGMPRDSDGRGHPILALLAMILAPIAAFFIQAAISRSREFNADKAGAEISGNPMPLATALEKIHVMANRVLVDVNPSFNSLFIAEPRNAFRTMANLFATHPPLESRLMNLIGRESTGQFRYAA